ncbi:hypothetical protein PSU4_39510 [Pseudonocardia sulfidoxydans NBRC 16205]|uniref:SpoVT-AbrB domain-containing protein n=2 Tax=Pseudonocardia sulfidoxydans TaxID=54011 RepID=A0A511DKQ7_9PSEU|nr:AbrB/MazE/SpoVT family DNA-binding domain-containing protein [Pseudonocardia sulfidoxydans]GEL24997.1 hypothetical protein PSU4_39510 [Pseudonocardia sulfidoxydans NBRC 16205]
MKLNSKGQVTIPAQLRAELDLREGDEVDVVLKDGDLIIVTSSAQPTRGRQLVDRMRGRADAGLTTDELMALTRGE